MLRWTEFLDVEAIRPSLVARDRGAVLHELAGLMSARAGVSQRELAVHLLAREQLGSTVMEGGVAVPHCRHAGVERIVTCLGIHRGGLAFGAPEDGLVRIYVGMVSPPDTAGLHLNVLSRIATLLHAPELRAELMAAPSAGVMRALLVRAEEACLPLRNEMSLAR
ncbi:PTS sugar transporter subunit IIA [Myxococcus llanfairpwllgwyngyllgogerychwyrndrobwllllantysiliogogogochensis]|uniref:PTS sugar transporter subunit IIA n=1 Tax=Myxococcus llanfairpwllgwyngyllgogerychwyrndrobwllllantysiliogogogochensis TaxID=2590453 RepID=A0A540X5X1_9BACT|nr:PTS sugar transporter subunit IIA [Myxococcus llanfairpwllgwyngyllgogerychwyrndrobwllllantysiliogogogochensis]TQF16638.1 PTS sugar transporter subunit IIA [Myxococcus llanfairpwllgwyngyllgogerychwyrndrobwllllantysiliogogogochensis]